MKKKRSKKQTLQMLTDSEMACLIRSIGILEVSSITVLSVTPLSDHRYSTILEISAGKETGKNLKIIIDVSFGGPTWRQFLDVTYNSGADCDLKVNVSNGPLDMTFDPFVAFVNLIGINNSCAIPTYFLEPNDSFLKAPRSISTFKILAGPDDVDPKGSFEPPSKRKIGEAEFWIEYFQGPFAEGSLEGDLKANGLAPYYPVGRHLSIVVRWTEQGLFMDLKSETTDQEITWLWKHKKQDIEKQYSGSPLVLLPGDNALQSLSIKINETPFSVCLQSMQSEKFSYAGLVQAKELEFCELIEKLLEDYHIGKRATHAPMMTRYILMDLNHFLTVIKELLRYLRKRLPKRGHSYISISQGGALQDRWKMTERFLAGRQLDFSTVMDLLEQYMGRNFFDETYFAKDFDLHDFKKKLGLGAKSDSIS